MWAESANVLKNGMNPSIDRDGVDIYRVTVFLCWVDIRLTPNSYYSRLETPTQPPQNVISFGHRCILFISAVTVQHLNIHCSVCYLRFAERLSTISNPRGEGSRAADYDDSAPGGARVVTEESPRRGTERKRVLQTAAHSGVVLAGFPGTSLTFTLHIFLYTTCYNIYSYKEYSALCQSLRSCCRLL